MPNGENPTALVYRTLLDDISNGVLQPGQWLREDSLAAKLGTSRTPVREALRSLAAEGLVEVIRNRGARVRNWPQDHLFETYNLRALLEGYAAQRAAEKADEDQKVRLDELHRQLERAHANGPPHDLDAIADLNTAFHSEIVAIAASPLLENFISTLASVSVVRRAFRGYSESDLSRSMLAHRDIALAIREGNTPLAEATMRSHILAAMYSAASVLHGSD